MVCAIAAALAGCGGKSLLASEQDTDRAQTLVNEEFELKGPRTFGAAWFAEADPEFELVCGTFVPEELAANFVREQRYVYMTDTQSILIDPIPELNITASPISKAAVTETHRVFDELWEGSCEKFRP